MKVIFMGRTRPYPRKDSTIAYGIVLGLPDDKDPACIQRDSYFGATDSKLDAQFHDIEPGTLLDLEAAPRIFAGKLSGFTVTGING